MEKTKNIILRGILILTCFATLISCGGIESIHEEYLTGETIYAGKLSNIGVYSGMKRIKIGGSIKYIGASDLCVVEWENQTKEFPIIKNEQDTFEIFIDGLEERGYEFKISTKDKDGNSSVEQIVTGKALGEQFFAAQRGRSIKQFNVAGTIQNPVFEVLWTGVELNENIVETTFIYEKADGSIETLLIAGNEEKTSCKDMKIGGEAEVQTKVKTGNMGVDTILIPAVYVELPKEAIMKVPSSGIRMKPYPGESDFNDYYGWDKMFNEIVNPNNPSESSIGSYSGFPQDNPAYLTLDLGFECQLSYFRIWQRGGDPCLYRDGNPINYEVYGAAEYPEYNSDNPLAGWTLLRSCTNSKPSKLPMGSVNTDDINFQTVGEKFDFNKDILKTRYIRFKFKDIYEPDKHYIAIGELAFWARAGV